MNKNHSTFKRSSVLTGWIFFQMCQRAPSGTNWGSLTVLLPRRSPCHQLELCSCCPLMSLLYCWWFRNPANQLIWTIYHYLQGLIHLRWCRISSINTVASENVEQNRWNHPSMTDFLGFLKLISARPHWKKKPPSAIDVKGSNQQDPCEEIQLS